ncbi:cyanate transporter [Paraburkholderia sp. ZP32-5]|uniref:cyanate transporter n=1 Tax=Paraburkholderia sp. ZP32-5 TaxID=2883245 RepID=UPI001F21F481|nr:cyanate transporter [Paraburkholderia sp. ZP32-5]
MSDLNPANAPRAVARGVAAAPAAMILLVLVGLNLRPFLTSVGPVLDIVRADTGLDFRAVAMLTTLPFVLMGVGAGVGAGLARRFGEKRALGAALLLLAAGCTSRLWAANGASLITGAGIAGAGVAMIQAMMPGLAKRWFPDRLPLAMGLYSAALVGGGAFGAVTSPWLATHGGWHLALAVWAVPALGTLALWLANAPRGTAGIGARAGIATGTNGNGIAISAFFRNPRAWQLAIYFGLANSGYSSLVAWLPSFYRQVGMSPQASGNLLAWMAVFQAAGALLVPMLARRATDRRGALWLTLALQAVGFAGFATLPSFAPWCWVACAGVGLGGFFALSLIVTLDHLSDAQRAGALAAFVQGVGFLLAATGPWLIGWLRDAGGGFAAAWSMHLAVAVAMGALTAAFSPASYRRSMALIDKL